MIKKTLTTLIIGYKRFISPLFPSSCRHTPTCSTYMMQAIQKHGVIIGVALGTWRIIRCNPWHHAPHYDPVPDTLTKPRWLDALIKRLPSAINANAKTKS